MSGVDVGTAYLSVVPSARGFGARLEAGLGDQMPAAGRRAGEDFSSAMGSRIKSSAKAVFAGLAIGGAALGGIGLAGAKMGLSVAAGNEQARISFTTMLGSAEKAQGFLDQMQKFAASTPFEFPELQSAASSLISAGISADKVIPIMRTLGDVTSGMGTGSEGVQRATIALQQMSAAGRITGEDLNQLRDAGVPVFDLLAAATGKTKEEVAGLAQAGKLGKKELGQLMSALESGKGLERFSGLMDKQSQSLTGLISTFKDTLGQGLAQAIEPAVPLIKDGLAGASALLAEQLPHVVKGMASLTAKVRELAPQVPILTDAFKAAFSGEGVTSDGLVGKVERLGVAARSVLDAYDQAKVGGSAFFAALRGGADDVSASDGIVGVLESLGVTFHDTFDRLKGVDLDSVKGIFTQLVPLLTDVSGSLPAVSSALDNLGKVFGFVADHIDLVVKAMPYLLAAFAAYKTLQIANNAVGKDSLFGFGLQTAATIALALANRSLAASNRAVAGSAVASATAENIGMLTRIRMTAATLAGAVASGVARVATIAWTAVQWLLNVALTANPIGLIVIAVAGLVALIVLIATKTTWFQTIWEYTWGAIQAIVKYTWNNVLQPVVNSMVTGFSILSGWVANLLEALSNVPGFGWAKDAADKLRVASDWAANLAGNIQKIPDRKTVDVDVNLAVNGEVDGVIAGIAARAGRNASGTPSWRGGLTWVGEQGPELISLPKGTEILNNRESMDLARPQVFQPSTSGGSGSAGTIVEQHYHGNIVTQDYREFERRQLENARRAALGPRGAVVRA